MQSQTNEQVNKICIRDHGIECANLHVMVYVNMKQKYEALVDGKMPIESHLHKHLAEHLNSEIALGTINNLEVAMNWMRSTYFYVRSMRNPPHYGLDENMDKDIIENKLEKMCLVQIQDLQKAGLIKRNPQNELDVQTTSYGKLMAKYYLSFETMKLFRQIRGDETYLKILDLVVRCREFSEFTLRVNEKRVLNALNDTPLRFPRAGRIKTREDKISCLLQAALGNVAIASPTLAQESLKMARIADRIAKCLLEYMRLSEQQGDAFHLGRYKALLYTVTIAKCFHAKLWENSEYAAKQLQKIGAVYSAQLVNAGKTTLKSLETTDARTIEAILNKSPPFGDEILQSLQQTFPEYICTLQMGRDSQTPSMLQISVRQVNESFIYRGTNAMIIVGDSSNQLLLFIEDLDALLVEYGCFMKTIKLPNPDAEKIHAHVVHATLVGVDVHQTLVIKEPAGESNLDIKTKKLRKRKQQTLNETIDNKKAKTNSNIRRNNRTTIKKKPNINLQSFEFSKSKILNDSTIAKFERDNITITENNDTVTEVEKNNETKTEKNNETKTEVGENNTIATERNNSIISRCEQNVKSLKMKKSHYHDLTNNIFNDDTLNETKAKSINNSTLVQTELTKYFIKRKYNTNESYYVPATSKRAKQSDLDVDKLKESQIEEKPEQNPISNSTLQALTQDLHEISAYLETQKSRESCERSQITKELADNRSEYYEMATQAKQVDSISTIYNTQNSVCVLANDTHFSKIFDTPKSIEEMRNNITVDETAEELNIHTTQTIEHNDIEPLNLATNKNVLSCTQSDDTPLKSTCSTLEQRYENKSVFLVSMMNKLNTNSTRPLKPTSGLVYPSCLDLTREDNLKMSWRQDSTNDDASVVSTTLTNKSADTLTNSPTSIENFLICYKVALAFARLSNKERTFKSFKNIYKRYCVSNAAIDFITAKLSKSGISRSERDTVVQRKATRQPIQQTKQVLDQEPKHQRYSDTPLNLAKKAEGHKSINYKENIIPSHIFKTAPLKQTKVMNNTKENLVHKTIEPAKVPAISRSRSHPYRLQIMNELRTPINNKDNRLPTRSIFKAAQPKESRVMESSKDTRRFKPIEPPKAAALSSNSRQNPYRLQIFNDLKKSSATTKTLNNDVMISVLNTKCELIAKSEEIGAIVEAGDQKLLTREEIEEIESQLEHNEILDSPPMSFKGFCKYVLQSANDK